jgi:hypothetical protein
VLDELLLCVDHYIVRISSLTHIVELGHLKTHADLLRELCQESFDCIGSPLFICL